MDQSSASFGWGKMARRRPRNN